MLPKKLITIALILCCYRGLWSQVVFCPPGAKWHYLESDYTVSGPNFSNEQITYLRDSIVSQDTVKVLLHNNFYSYCNFTGNVKSLIKQKGDTIFLRNATTLHGWQVLYNFAALAGQSWTMTIYKSNTPSSFRTYTVTVDSVNYSNVNGFVLKNLFVKYKYIGNNITITNPTQITERFGSTRFLFFYGNPNFYDCYEAHDGINQFLCYQDSAFGLKQFGSFPCDYTNPLGISESNIRQYAIEIYPTPVNDFLNVRLHNEQIVGEICVSIRDLSGREVKQVNQSGINPQSKIDLSDLDSGLYFIRISDKDQEIYAGKLLKY
jgi:hypothetical protein